MFLFFLTSFTFYFFLALESYMQRTELSRVCFDALLSMSQKEDTTVKTPSGIIFTISFRCFSLLLTSLFWCFKFKLIIIFQNETVSTLVSFFNHLCLPVVIVNCILDF